MNSKLGSSECQSHALTNEPPVKTYHLSSAPMSELQWLSKSIWPPFRRPRFESSLASHTLLREEVSGHAATIELPPQQKLAVINEVCALHRLHLLLWSSNYVTCLADVSISLSNRSVWYFKLQSMHGDNSSAAAWPDPSFLQRVWLAD